MSKSLFAVISRAVHTPSASLTDWLGSTIRLTDRDGFWSQAFGTQSTSGKTVTDHSALQITAVWACTRLISETIATLPVSLYKRQDDGGREVASGHDLHWILRSSPNERMTTVEFWVAVLVSILLRGNAYIRVHRSGTRVIALDFLLPTRMDLDCDTAGNLIYWYTPPKGKRQQIPRQDMMHIPGFSLDGRIGLSAISYGANLFGSAISADEAAGKTFNNGLLQTVAFKVDRILKPEQRDEFREYVKTISGAMNAGKSPVLEQGITPETIGINPTDAQLLESRGWSAEEICRFFLVDPTMVGYGDKASNWGSGLEEKMLRFLTFTLRTYLRRIEESISKHLLTPAERRLYYPEFAIEGLLRADSSARAAFYSTMTQNGIYTRDDCRVRENLPRRGGNADVLTVQTNLSPIDQLGQSNDGQAARAALKNWLDEPESPKE